MPEAQGKVSNRMIYDLTCRHGHDGKRSRFFLFLLLSLIVCVYVCGRWPLANKNGFEICYESVQERNLFSRTLLKYNIGVTAKAHKVCLKSIKI